MSKVIKGKTYALGNAEPVESYIIKNKKGTAAEFLTLGVTLRSFFVSDRNGRIEDVVLGCEAPDDYLHQENYFGCVIGRCASRIANAKFSIDGREYLLAANEGNNHCHGGLFGFDKKIWKPSPITDGVRFSLISPDGDEGYPGELRVSVDCTLSEQNELCFEYRAVSDKDTVVNLTNHSYFNLTGKAQSILSHELKLFADRYTPARHDLVPVGSIENVQGTAFDFRQRKSLISALNSTDEQILLAGGLDHNFVVDGKEGDLRPFAELYEPESGRLMICYTTCSGVQVYSANEMLPHAGKEGRHYAPMSGLCLETQSFPNAVNTPGFGNVVLRRGAIYHSKTVYRFAAR